MKRASGREQPPAGRSRETVIVEVTYSLTQGDIYQFQLHYEDVRDQWAYRRFRWGLPALWLGIGLMIFGFGSRMSDRLLGGVFCLFGIAACFVAPWLWRAIIRKNVRTYLKVNPDFEEEIRLSFTESGYIVANRNGETRMAWAGVRKLTETSDLLCLWLAPRVAMIVPKRAFEQQPEMLGRVRQYYASAANLAS
jgi:hypothetical protein